MDSNFRQQEMLPLYQQGNFYKTMADVNKSKLQLRSGLSSNDDKSPSPATKLLINHGKPNFTIPRSYKTQNGNAKPTSPTPAAAANFQNNNNTEFIVKSTAFNGVFKSSNVSAATKQTLPQNGNNEANEAAKVVLRRPNVAQMEMREREDDENVPEFIRRQRRIQERLANQNILDFENRRSGYFTQVMISPSSPNRQSFAETMASPAVKPGLEMPTLPAEPENTKIEATLIEQEVEPPQQNQQHQRAEIQNVEEAVNGQVEEEEVAKAIEEVNKAVEGEDDDRTESEEPNKNSPTETKEDERAAAAEENEQPKNDEMQKEEEGAAHVATEEPEVSSAAANTKENEPVVETACAAVSVTANPVKENKSNGHVEEMHENYLSKDEELHTSVTISHANGFNGPSIPAPDPSGEKGVNYEPKTVVSFSQELGNGDNKYPDTAKVIIKDNELSTADSELKEFTKLKFEIKADNQDIEVKPVLVNETA